MPRHREEDGQLERNFALVSEKGYGPCRCGKRYHCTFHLTRIEEIVMTGAIILYVD